MQIVGIIPARYQSSRFPGKPLADIHGKPMIQRVFERTSRARRLHRVLVATDDPRILEAVEAFGGEAVMTGARHSSGTDRLAEAGRLIGLSPDDIVVNVQGDEPLIEPVMIDRLVEALQESPRSPMATLAFPGGGVQDKMDYLNPNVVKVVVDDAGRALYFSRSPIPHGRDAAEEEITFLRHLGFYAYHFSFLRIFTELPPGKLELLEKLEQLRALEHGYSIQVALSPVRTGGVDTPQDMEDLLSLGPEIWSM
jgi:3-deoxy-manno-octulosonate cytidylyltransferase (CMP-KDO synthetase)